MSSRIPSVTWINLNGGDRRQIDSKRSVGAQKVGVPASSRRPTTDRPQVRLWLAGCCTGLAHTLDEGLVRAVSPVSAIRLHKVPQRALPDFSPCLGLKRGVPAFCGVFEHVGAVNETLKEVWVYGHEDVRPLLSSWLVRRTTTCWHMLRCGGVLDPFWSLYWPMKLLKPVISPRVRLGQVLIPTVL